MGGCDWIDRALEWKGNKVLIHCAEGRNRSATFLIAYLMSKLGKPLGETLKMVRDADENCGRDRIEHCEATTGLQTVTRPRPTILYNHALLCHLYNWDFKISEAQGYLREPESRLEHLRDFLILMGEEAYLRRTDTDTEPLPPATLEEFDRAVYEIV